MSSPIKTLLVLGGSSDIAAASMKFLDLSNATVIAHYHRSAEKIERLKEESAALRFVPVKADLSEQGDVERLIETVRAEGTCPTHVLHAAAPHFERIHFHKTDPREIASHFATQVLSVARVLHAFLPAMANSGEGKIVFILSSYTIGERPVGVAPYTVAKYALLGLMRSLAGEYARRGICVNAISPSMVETAYIADLPRIAIEMAVEQSPLKRLALPEDIAPLVRFLFSGESNYINGANIPVCGGSVF